MMKPHFQYQRQHQHAPIKQCSIMSIEEHEGDSEVTSTYENTHNHAFKYM